MACFQADGIMLYCKLASKISKSGKLMADDVLFIKYDGISSGVLVNLSFISEIAFVISWTVIENSGISGVFFV